MQKSKDQTVEVFRAMLAEYNQELYRQDAQREARDQEYTQVLLDQHATEIRLMKVELLRAHQKAPTRIR